MLAQVRAREQAVERDPVGIVQPLCAGQGLHMWGNGAIQIHVGHDSGAADDAGFDLTAHPGPDQRHSAEQNQETDQQKPGDEAVPGKRVHGDASLS